jgi:hypothetical protein
MKFYQIMATAMLTNNCKILTIKMSDKNKEAAEIGCLRSVAGVVFSDLKRSEDILP